MFDNTIRNYLIISVIFFNSVLISEAIGSTAAWTFAHRVNFPSAVNAAANDVSVNAVEIDVTYNDWGDTYGSCPENTWCAFHSGDGDAYPLQRILQLVKSKSNLHAVWLDVKSVDASSSEAEDLVNIVKDTLGKGDNTVRKFWGVWGKDYMTKQYVTTIRNNMDALGGNDENVFIVEVDGSNHADYVQTQCSSWRLQCGISAGNPFLGNGGNWAGPSWDMNNLSYIDNKIKDKANINSVFMWTFNWGTTGEYEDDMIRLLFKDRAYWEYLSGLAWHCGQEGNGVIIGNWNSVYDENFCTGSGSACDEANQAIASGPNHKGNRSSDIGAPRNSYTTTGECEK